MSEPPKRGIPVKKKVNVGSSNSSLGTADSQTSVYKKTTIKTVVEKRSRHAGTSESQTTAGRSGLRPPSASTSTGTRATDTRQQSQLRPPSSRTMQQPQCPAAAQQSRLQAPGASRMQQTGSRIGTVGQQPQRPVVGARPMVQQSQTTRGGSVKPQYSIVPPSASRIFQEPQPTATGPARQQQQRLASSAARQLQQPSSATQQQLSLASRTARQLQQSSSTQQMAMQPSVRTLPAPRVFAQGVANVPGRLQPPGASQLRPPSGLRAPAISGIQPPGMSRAPPQSQLQRPGVSRPVGSGISQLQCPSLSRPQVQLQDPIQLMNDAAPAPSRLPAPSGIQAPLPSRIAARSRSGVPSATQIGPQGVRSTHATTQLRGPPQVQFQVPATDRPQTRPLPPSDSRVGVPAPRRAYPRQLQAPAARRAIPPPVQPSQLPPQRSVPSAVQVLTGGAIPTQGPMHYSKHGAIRKPQGAKVVKKVSSKKITKERLPSPPRPRRQEIVDSMQQSSACGPTCPSKSPQQPKPPSPPAMSALEQELESSMVESMKRRSKTPLRGTASRRTIVSPPMMTTDQGPIPASAQIISRKTIIKEPGMPEIIARDLIGIETTSPTQAEKTEVAIQRSKPLKRSQMATSKEMLIVESSVMIAPGGLQQSVKTVSFDGDPSHIQPAPAKRSPQKIAQLVQQETDLINQIQALHLPMPDVKHISPLSYLVRKKATGYAIEPQAVAALEQSVLQSGIKPAADPDEPTPEMLASLMNAEERGLAMGTAPANVYQFLFPAEASDEPIIEVTSAAPAPLQDVVVPSVIPDLSQGKTNEEIRAVADKAEVTLNMEEINAASYCAVVGEEPIQQKNIAKKGTKTKRKRVTLLNKEVPPWGIEDVPPVIDLVGGPLAESKVVHAEAVEEVDPLVEGIEYLLQMEAPVHNTLIQLRGAQKPPWFPGYIMALPDSDKLITIAKSPSVVLASAWKAVQPDIFNDNSLYVN